MKKVISIFLCLIILFSFGSSASAGGNYDINSVVSDTAKYLYKTVSKPQVGSVGGEWAVLGLARSYADVPKEYFENYYQTVEKYVKDHGGVLHNKKYTEYSRVIVALTSIGKNPADVGGYNLLIPLGDYEKTVWQGLNGAVWALIALDSGEYDIPSNPDSKVQATREMYINHILGNQLPNGGWAISNAQSLNSFDPDMTGMALQALAKYQSNERVEKAIEKALTCISQHQADDGGFRGYDNTNLESTLQIMIALCELGISVNDPRFVKDGKTVFDNIMTYYSGGGFVHTKDTKVIDQMATEQALCGLVALKRQTEGKSSLYLMNDPLLISQSEQEHPAKPDIVYENKTFEDITYHKNKGAIEALASRGIVNGKTIDTFDPDGTMTRAEFTAIITRGLGISNETVCSFVDVNSGDWFFDYVNTAYSFGIVKGVSANMFNPYGTITLEEAAVMVIRAAEICGFDTEMQSTAVRDVLAVFADYTQVSDWARQAVAVCYDNDILPQSDLLISPKHHVTRGEVSQMLYNMLNLTNFF